MIIYIHGFGGSGDGIKARKFKALNHYERIIAPSLSYVPDLAIATLSELIETLQQIPDASIAPIKLIGSSLGGYYALYLANKYDLKAVLLNPAVYPYNTLQRSLGYAPNFYDQSTFEWNADHLAMLKKFEVSELKKSENILLLLQKGDDILDYREAYTKLEGVASVVQENGSHSFDNIEELFDEIERFLDVSFG